MNHEAWFAFANTFALVGWILLAFFPQKTITKYLVRNGIWPAVLSVVYVVAVTSGMSGETEGSFSTFAGVTALFSDPSWLLAGWIHYLAFDLLIGIWIVRDSEIHNFNRYLTIPFLVGTFMLGPIGFVLYWILRTAKKRFIAELYS